MAGDLEQLARQGRSNDARFAHAEQVRQQWATAERQKEAQRRIRAALCGGTSPVLIVLTILVGLGAIVAITFTSPFGLLIDMIVMVAVMLGGTGFAFAAMSWRTKRRAAAEMGWLRSLPFGFALDAYLQGLVEERFTSVVTVSIQLQQQVDAATAETIGAATAGAADVAKWTWQGATLHVLSPRLTTGSMRASSSTTHTGPSASFYNAPIHRWFRTLVERGLLTIHARYPLAQVHVSVQHAV